MISGRCTNNEKNNALCSQFLNIANYLFYLVNPIIRYWSEKIWIIKPRKKMREDGCGV